MQTGFQFHGSRSGLDGAFALLNASAADLSAVVRPLDPACALHGAMISKSSRLRRHRMTDLVEKAAITAAPQFLL
jgi:hypothetical protein